MLSPDLVLEPDAPPGEREGAPPELREERFVVPGGWNVHRQGVQQVP